MCETRGELRLGDVSELAHQIRELIGVGDFDRVGVMLPQFDQTDGKVVSIVPASAEWLDTLKTAPLDILRDIGLQRWDEGNLWLFPVEWYDHIPEGYEVVGVRYEVKQFCRGTTDPDRRCGCLPFGLLAVKKSLM